MQGVGSQGSLRHIDAVGIGVVLRAGAGVLQIIPAVVLCHKGPLDKGLADGMEQPLGCLRRHAVRQGGVRGQVQLLCHRVHIGDKHLVHGAALFVHHAVFPGPLVAQTFRVPSEQGLPFPDGLQGLPVQLHAPDGVGVGAAPEEVQPAVVVQKQIWVPEGEGSGHLLKGLGQGVGAAKNGAGGLAAAGGKVQIPVNLPHVGGIVIGLEGGVRVELPVYQVLTVPKARRHGDKQIVGTPKQRQSGVGPLPAAEGALAEVLIPVGQIQGIAIGLTCHRSPP